MYDFLNRIHARGWIAAHVVRCLSLIFALIFSSSVRADLCMPENFGSLDSYCISLGGSPLTYGPGVVGCVLNGVWQRTYSAPTQCSTLTPDEVCQAKVDEPPLQQFVAFYHSTVPPAQIASNEPLLTAVVAAHNSSAPIGNNVCISNCRANLQMPPQAEISGVYAIDEPAPGGGWDLYRRTDIYFDGSQCSAGGISSERIVATAISPSQVDGNTSTTPNGSGTGGASSCAPGDTRASCAELSSAPSEGVPSVTVSIGAFTPETQHFGGGRCPNNVFMTFHGVNKNLKVWDWQQTCATLETYIKPLVLLMGAISAFFIVLGISAPLQTPQGGA